MPSPTFFYTTIAEQLPRAYNTSMPAAVRPEDIAFNRVSVALARSQSLVASWLPPRPAEDATAEKTPEQLKQAESALFTPGSDILGVGAEPPKEIGDGSFKRNQLSSNDRLRQQLLGKHAAKSRAPQSMEHMSGAASHLPIKKVEKPAKPARVQDDSDDEEDGRAAMFKSKRRTASATVRKEEPKDGSGSESEVKGKVSSRQDTSAAPAAQEMSRKRPVSFLDEILEERSKKRKKKQKPDQAKLEASSEPEKMSFKETLQEVPELTMKETRGEDEDSSDRSNEETGNSRSRPTASNVLVKDKEPDKPSTPADSILFDRSDKKKRKKKKKKSKGEASGQS